MALTIKQEKFCQKYVELGNASEAYRQSYNCENYNESSITSNAHKLLKNTDILLTIENLKSNAARRHNITIDDLLDELTENRALALQEGQASAATSATMGKAKLLGLDVTKLDHSSSDGSFKPVFNFTPVEPKATDESSD